MRSLAALGLLNIALAAIALAACTDPPDPGAAGPAGVPTAMVVIGELEVQPAGGPARGTGPAPHVVSPETIGVYNEGLRAQSSGNTEAAVEAYRRAIAADGQFAAPMYNLALIRGAVPGGEQEAIDLYRRVTQLTPDNASAYYNMGLLLVGTGRKAEGDAAIARYQEIIARSPTPTPAPR